MKRLLLLLLFVLFALPAHAACTGSGTVWSCPAGASVSDAQAAINKASDGAVITFAAGSYTWAAQVGFSESKGVTLICVTQGACTVGATNGAVLGIGLFTQANNAHLYRISGFVFNQSQAQYLIQFGASCNRNCVGVLSQIRIDHNTFNLATGGTAVLFGDTLSVGNFYGVIDHNTVASSGGATLLIMVGASNPSPPTSPLGTANNLFVEDNTITSTKMANASAGPCMDGWGGDAIVFRHNTTLNCLVTSHGSTHAGGPQNIEFYNNSVSVNAGAVGASVEDCYRCFHHQGSGEFIAFNNTFTAYSGKNATVISMLHYRDYANGIDGAPLPYGTTCDGTQAIDGNRSPTSTHQGYPCFHQPGRDFAGNLQPMYVWNNYWSDTLAQIPMVAEHMGGYSPDYYGNHMQANREYFNAVSASAQSSPTSPFDGTIGMGFGTLANRPTTCMTNTSESGGGVGYFATDAGPQGTLYQCSATNTWTVYYTPYIYPHPLQGSGSSAVVTPPTNLGATVN